MSRRLEVWISPELDAKIEQAAQRGGLSKGEWVRRALLKALDRPAKAGPASPVDRLASLGAPTADIEEMLSEIATGWP